MGLAGEARMLQQEVITGHAVPKWVRAQAVGFALFAASAWGEHFMAPLARTEWQVERSAISCRLRQPVPRYGDAVFETRAGGSQSFTLRAQQNPMVEGPTAVTAMAPAWNPQREPVDLGTYVIAGGNQPLRLDGSEPQRLLDYLSDGLALKLARPLVTDHREEALLALSPLDFRPAYRKYQDCIQRMVPISYEQIVNTTVSFSSERSELSAQAQQKIDRMLRYVQADRAITGFSLQAVSSDTPRRLDNLQLAKARAQQVQEYLMSRGIAEQKITTEYRGERAGKGDLRSVTIRLRRTD